ncbi:FliM/FliN family flagellar motor switch protein [Sphingomonas sp.]|jgi:flagellar motor switch protein FliN/FliY|uniref:FliM/FliN family flagellar motor switch protein n=1 Tax=Sphingomonas sp. TaxID=28214 RepID=UPI002E324663|nr:FliM/FliN family flagellar motor switch protein [Sphingomonas sp.]HEX4695790.1 FliM/FliN family flagellar motor switch protein [Sphingomonas sp.]
MTLQKGRPARVPQTNTAATKSDTTPARPLAARMIDDVEVEIEAFVGNARMTVAELGALAAESVVTLDAPLNQAVELRLNGVVVAHGELVAVGDKFGVRLTELAA